MSRVIFFHASCMDGFGALWAYKPDNEDILIPSVAGQTLVLPEIKNEYGIVCLDISPPVSQLEELLKQDSLLYFVVIDHHKIDQDKYRELSVRYEKLRLFWDDKKSGAILSWERGSVNPPPRALLYIQDRDLWTWKMDESKAVNEAMYSQLRLPTQKSTQKEIRDELEKFSFVVETARKGTGLESLIEQGQEILKKTETIIEFLTNQAEKSIIEIGDQKYKVFLSPTRQYRSEVGSSLMKRKWGEEYPDFSVCYTLNFPTKEVWLSLRSVDGKTDVSRVMKNLDEKSGGHRNAAGATLPVETFLSILRPIS